jgi:hypothetical protein
MVTRRKNAESLVIFVGNPTLSSCDRFWVQVLHVKAQADWEHPHTEFSQSHTLRPARTSPSQLVSLATTQPGNLPGPGYSRSFVIPRQNATNRCHIRSSRRDRCRAALKQVRSELLQLPGSSLSGYLFTDPSASASRRISSFGF